MEKRNRKFARSFGRFINVELVLLLLFNFVALFKILVLDRQLAYGDLPPFPESYQKAFEDFLFVWKDFSFGLYRYPGHLQPLLHGVLIFLFGNAVAAQKAYIFMIPVISYLSFNYLIKCIYKNVTRVPLFLSSFFYAYSPIFIQEFMGGTLYSSILGFSLLPLVYARSFLLYEKANLKNTFLLSIVLGLVVSFYPHFFIIYAISMMLPFLADCIVNRFGNYKVWLWFVFTVVLTTLLNPVFILTSFNVVRTTVGVSSSSFSSNIPNFLTDVHYTYFWSTLANIFRFGNNNSPHGYSTLSPWTVQFYFVVGFVFFYVLFVRLRKWSNPFQFSFFPSLLLIYGFMYLTNLNQTDLIFKVFTPLIMFRNPAKLTYLAFFFFSLLFFESLSWVEEKSKFDITKGLFFIPISLSILIYIWPVFTQDFALSRYRKGVVIPNIYREILSAIDKGEGRNLWLPASHESTSIKLVWLDQNKLESQIGVAQFSDDYYVDRILNPLNTSLIEGKNTSAKNLLNMAQVSNVVVLVDSKGKLSTETAFGVRNVKGGSALLKSYLNFLPEVTEGDSYSIFKNQDYYGTFFIPDTFAYLSEGANAGSFLNFVGEKSRIALINFDNHKEFLKDDFSIVWSGKKHTDYPLDGWDSLWAWPNPSIDPKSPFLYELVNLKERFLILSEPNFFERNEKLLWITSKRAEEVIKFGIYDGDLRKRILVNYYSGMYQLFTMMKDESAVTDSRFQKFLRKYSQFLERGVELIRINDSDGDVGIKILELKKEVANFKSKFSYACKLDNCFYGRVPTFGEYEISLGLEYSGESPFQGLFFLSSDSKGSADEVKYTLEAGDEHKLGTFYLDGSNFYGIEIEMPETANLVPEGQWEREVAEAVSSDIDFVGSGEWLYPLFKEKRYTRVSTERYKGLSAWKERGSYMLSFDYALRGGKLGYAIVERDKVNGKYSIVVSGEISPNIKSNRSCEGKQCFVGVEKKFLVSGLGKEARIVFFISGGEDVPKKAEIVNVAVKKINQPTLIIKPKTIEHEVLAVPSVKYEKLNQFIYDVSVSDLSGDSLLVFNKSFNAGWRLYEKNSCSEWLGNLFPQCVLGKKGLIRTPQLRVNGYANSWVLKGVGSSAGFYVVFVPQLYYFFSLAVSITLVIVITLVLLIRRVKLRQ